jgi:hypothetical protein
VFCHLVWAYCIIDTILHVVTTVPTVTSPAACVLYCDAVRQAGEGLGKSGQGIAAPVEGLVKALPAVSIPCIPCGPVVS